MKKNIIVLFLIVMSGCSGYQYTASPHFTPLSTEKGEFKARIGINNIQLGYTVSDHFSLFTTAYFRYRATNLDYNTMFSKENSGDDIFHDKSYEINLGGSCFYKQNKMIYEILLGGGFGYLDFKHIKDVYIDDYEFNMFSPKYNLFVQPNIGIKFNEHINLNLSTKFSYQYFYNIKSNLILGDLIGVIPDSYFYNIDNAGLLFLEPGLTFQFGSEKFKMQIQAIPVFNFENIDIYYKRFSFYVNMAIDLDFNNK